jgi:hypothetical protein
MIPEHLLHFIWRFRLFNQVSLLLHSGESLEIITPGNYHQDSGPDFQNARIRIDDTLWAGNIEIHLRSSDWFRHHHETDAAYNNIILHVVLDHDAEVLDKNNHHVAVLELRSLIASELFHRWNLLNESMFSIPCASLGRPDVMTMRNWLDRLVAERLEAKASRVALLLKQNKNHWQETMYCFLFRSMGMQTNAIPFELLARSVPYSIIQLYKQSRFQLEAILFGQSGLLHEEHADEYPILLWEEYLFLKKKHKLKPMDGHLWKFLRMRPLNFPSIRIAQLADLLSVNTISPDAFREMQSVSEWKSWFNVSVSPYWEEHFVFDKPCKKQKKMLGKSAGQSLLINALVPFLFMYATHLGDDLLKERVLDVLYKLSSEKNGIINEWIALGIQPNSAAESQGLIQLKLEYCDKRQCLNCALGHRILKEFEKRQLI